MAFWVIKTRPKWNDFSKFPIKNQDTRWYTDRIPKTNWNNGDLLFIWAGAPKLQVIGLAVLKVRDLGPDKQGDHHFKVRNETNLIDGPTLPQLRKMKSMQGASFLQSGPSGTVFSISNAQGKLMLNLVGKIVKLRLGPRVVPTNKEDAVVSSRLGAGFGTPEENKQVEVAAITAARRHLTGSGWSVESKERDKIGYDLECRRGKLIMRVEVKGIRGIETSFIITAREYNRAGTDSKFVLCVVTSALSAPRVRLFDSVTLRSNLAVVPLAYKATLRG